MINRPCCTSYQTSPSSAIPCFPRDSLHAFKHPFCDVTAVWRLWCSTPSLPTHFPGSHTSPARTRRLWLFILFLNLLPRSVGVHARTNDRVTGSWRERHLLKYSRWAEGGREGGREGEREGGEGEREGGNGWRERRREGILGNTEHYNDCVIVVFYITLSEQIEKSNTMHAHVGPTIFQYFRKTDTKYKALHNLL